MSSQRSHATATRWRRRRVIAAAAALAVVLSVACLLIFDIGIPSGHHAAAPDPCQLIDDQTRQQLVGRVSPSGTHYSGVTGSGLSYEEELRTCYWAGQEDNANSLNVTVYRFSDTQLHLASSGADRAQRLFQSGRAEFQELYGRDCTPTAAAASGDVCGISDPDGFGFTLFIRHQNVFLQVLFTQPPREQPVEWLEQRMAEATSQILAALDPPR